MPRPMISLIHTTARPDIWFETCKKWYDWCDNPDDVEYCLCNEPGKGLYNLHHLPWFNHRIIANQGRPCLVDGWNTAAAISTGTLMVGIADDLVPTGPHWDTQLLDAVPQEVRDREAFIWPSTSSPSDSELCIHPILTRSYYERFGYWFYPEYWAPFADNENWDVANLLGAVFDIRDKLNFDHQHPVYKKRDDDAVYTKNLSRWDADRALYFKRKQNGFLRRPE